MNEGRRKKLRRKLEKKLSNIREQLDLLDALDSWEAFGQAYPPISKATPIGVTKKKPITD